MSVTPAFPSGTAAAPRRRDRLLVGTVSARAVLAIIRAAVAAGVPGDVLTRVAGLTDTDVDDPDARVSTTAEIAVWQLITRQVPDPAFGVRAGSAFKVRDAGLLGYVVSFTPTLRGALTALQRYIHVFSQALTIELEDDHVSLITTASAQGLEPAPFAQDYRAAAVLSAARQITGVNLAPADVHFAHAQPRSILAHREFFRSRLHFASRVPRLVFRHADLRLLTLRGDADLARYLGQYADQVLASLVQGETLRHKVRAVIWAESAVGRSTLGAVAAAVRMTPRTLQRQLREEGTSFQRELQEVRKTVAIAALRNPDVAIDDVAFLLGYAEPSAFYRSFRRWTGRTPQEFRRLTA
jgi:AraC-like DNA-binding protein